LTNFEAFAANAFFTAGMVIFEIPTGVVADTVGRRTSYLLGTVTLCWHDQHLELNQTLPTNRCDSRISKGVSLS
jgi:MFS family permease